MKLNWFYLAAFSFGFILCFFLFRENSNGNHSSKEKRQIDSLRKIVLFDDFKIKKYKDTLKSKDDEILVIHNERIKVKQEVSVWKKKYFDFKKPILLVNCKDSVVYLESKSSTCDSLVDNQNKLISKDSIELKLVNEKTVVQDSIINNLSQQNVALKKIDTAHSVIETRLTKEGNRKARKFGIGGVILGILLTLIL